MSDKETLELLRNGNKKEYVRIMEKAQKKDEEFIEKNKDVVVSSFMSRGDM